MSRRRVVLLGLVVIAVAAAGYVAFRHPQSLGFPAPPEVRPVPSGDQEIAWIHTATNSTNWERFVEGVRHVEQTLRESKPELGLAADFSNAFPEQTTVVPEVVLRVHGSPHRLWFRWYKLTADQGNAYWVEKLAHRNPPPLAIIGGGSSDRARDLARELQNIRAEVSAPPLLLITTATADEVFVPGDGLKSLLAIYPDRSFRFCFTNRQMAEAVVSFLWRTPEFGHSSLLAGAVPYAAGGNVWGSLALVAAGSEPSLARVYALEWADDPYSVDLSHQFRGQLAARNADIGQKFRVPYSVGDYHRPNPWEMLRAEELLAQMRQHPDQRPILVVPAVDRAARRLLRALASSAPRLLREQGAVAVGGDSINFETIHRDRQFAWHIQDIPIPLVFFSHENPVYWPNGSGGNAGQATDDMLHNANIVRAVVDATFADHGSRLRPIVTGPDELAQRLRNRDRNRDLFDPSGNRKGGSGEFIIYLRPQLDEGRVTPEANIEVWSWQGATETRGRWWRHHRTLTVRYGEGDPTHDAR